MSVKEKAAAPVSSVGADGKQPLSKSNKESIADLPDKGNLQATNNGGSGAGVSAEKRDKIDRLETVSMTELYDIVYPPKIPIVDGLIYAGTYLFVGAPKVGKSFFMAQLGYHVSMGLDLWDYPVRKGIDKNGVYLSMKKVGKNNPKAEQIEADNRVRTMWNQTVDRALVSGVPEKQILDVKQSEIGQKAKASIQKSGRNPALFKSLIMTAIYALELLISKVFKLALEKADKVTEAFAKSEPEQMKVWAVNEPVMAKSEPIPEMPKKSELVSKYPRLADIYNKLERQNTAIYQREQQLANVELFVNLFDATFFKLFDSINFDILQIIQ